MLKAKFIERKNRFCALVELNGETVPVHVANSGRLKELLVPDAEVYVTEAGSPGRLTAYDLSLVNYGGRLVSVDARVPNLVVAQAVLNGELEELKGCRLIKKEVPFGHSRFDLLLKDVEGKSFFIEIKSSTLVTDDIARFPDAPTKRGSRHLAGLIDAVAEGYRAAVIFLIQREDAAAFSPNDLTDPEFGRILRESVNRGVEVYAYICQVDCSGVQIVRRVPVVL